MSNIYVDLPGRMYIDPLEYQHDSQAIPDLLDRDDFLVSCPWGISFQQQCSFLAFQPKQPSQFPLSPISRVFDAPSNNKVVLVSKAIDRQMDNDDNGQFRFGTFA